MHRRKDVLIDIRDSIQFLPGFSISVNIDDVTVKLKGPKTRMMSRPLNNDWKTFTILATKKTFFCFFLRFNSEKFAFSYSSSISLWSMQSFSFRVLTFSPFFKDKIYCYIFRCVSQLGAEKKPKRKGEREKKCFNTIFFLKHSFLFFVIVIVAFDCNGFFSEVDEDKRFHWIWFIYFCSNESKSKKNLTDPIPLFWLFHFFGPT